MKYLITWLLILSSNSAFALKLPPTLSENERAKIEHYAAKLGFTDQRVKESAEEDSELWPAYLQKLPEKPLNMYISKGFDYESDTLDYGGAILTYPVGGAFSDLSKIEPLTVKSKEQFCAAVDRLSFALEQDPGYVLFQAHFQVPQQPSHAHTNGDMKKYPVTNFTVSLGECQKDTCPRPVCYIGEKLVNNYIWGTRQCQLICKEM